MLDPWIQLAQLSANDAAASDEFGRAVAISGDLAIIGAPQESHAGDESGSAYIFARNSATPDTWAQVTKLTASDAAPDDHFGTSVAISGDMAIVGASGASNGSGSAYIFMRNQNGQDQWSQLKKLTANDAMDYHYFGNSVAIDGDVAIVGSYFDSHAGDGSGSAYVFTQNQGGDPWIQVKKLTASDASSFNFFGKSVAISGDLTIIGAYGKNNREGSVYIYERHKNGDEQWGQIKKFRGQSTNHRFGWAVDINEDLVIVANNPSDALVGTNTGSTYIFARDQGGTNHWGRVKKLDANHPNNHEICCDSVSISQDMAIIGTSLASASGPSGSFVRLYARDQGGSDQWGQTQTLDGSSEEALDRFGSSVAISQDWALVGAPKNNDAAPGAGAARVFGPVHAPAPVANPDATTIAQNESITIDVLANDTAYDIDAVTLGIPAPPTHGNASVNADNTILYTPPLNYNGADSFDYRLQDDFGVSTSTVSITITSLNDAPDAGDISDAGNISDADNAPDAGHLLDAGDTSDTPDGDDVSNGDDIEDTENADDAHTRPETADTDQLPETSDANKFPDTHPQDADYLPGNDVSSSNDVPERSEDGCGCNNTAAPSNALTGFLALFVLFGMRLINPKRSAARED